MEALKLRSWVSDPHQSNRPKVPIGGTTGLKRAVHSTATHMWPQSRLYWCRATRAHLPPPQLWYQWHRAEPLPMLNLCFHSPYKMEKHNFPPAPERQNGENKNKQKEKIPLVRWTSMHIHNCCSPAEVFWEKKNLQSKVGINTDDTEQRIKGRKFPQLSIFVRNRDFLGSFSRWKNWEKEKRAAPSIMKYIPWQNAACLVSKDP